MEKKDIVDFLLIKKNTTNKTAGKRNKKWWDYLNSVVKITIIQFHIVKYKGVCTQWMELSNGFVNYS